jgi:hypothetical protein
MLGQVLERDDSHGEAIAALERAWNLSQGNVKPLALKAYTHARIGELGRATELLRMLEMRARDHYVPPTQLALAHLALGHHDEVFAALDHAVSERDVHIVFLPVDAKWAAVSADRRFQAVLERCGLRGIAHAVRESARIPASS